MSTRKERNDELLSLIESMDSGVIQITVHKGMPVKFQLVSKQEIIIGGGQVDKLDSITWFTDRKWWQK
jgi:hypothetical protein